MEKDYLFSNKMPTNNSQDTFVVLLFSGGGTRSSAFAYGVLEKLRDTSITIDGKSRPVLDEVDIISAVSGGSYTAAYYGLFGKRIFRDYERIFLNRNIQADMLKLLLNPINLVKLINNKYNRGDLIATWLNKHIFENKTFADMSKGELPYIMLNASDINTGITFSFIQQQFDFLCSDISKYPVGHAVMASSSVPGVFAPISLNNPESECARKTKPWDLWVKNSLENDEVYDRRFQVARALKRYYEPSKMPKIKLVDGGVTDNLGIRGSILNPVAHYGDAQQMKGVFSPGSLDKVKRVLVLVANAQTYENYQWSQKGKDPGLLDTLEASFTAGMGILNTETITQARDSFQKWEDLLNSQRSENTPKVKVYFSTLTFDQIADEKKRELFNAIPTTFKLTKKDVNTLRKLAGELLDQSEEFQAFTNSMQENQSIK